MERTTNPISQELDAIRSMNIGEKQKFMYDWMDKHYEECKVYSLSELPEDLRNTIITATHFTTFKKHECYVNATNMLLNARGIFSSRGYDIHYIEGKMTIGKVVPIDHAWVKFISRSGDTYYFDPTSEFVLDNSNKDEIYVKFLELNIDETFNILLEKQYYGSWIFDIVKEEYDRVQSQVLQ